MADDGAVEVVSEVRQDAAVEGATRVAEAAIVGDSIIAGEVAAVADQLEDHQEASEERHEEILGDTSWLANQMATLLTTAQNLSTQLAALSATVPAMQTAILAQLEVVSLKLSQVSNPSIPPAEAPITAAIVVEEPAAGVEDRQEAATGKRKRHRII